MLVRAEGTLPVTDVEAWATLTDWERQADWMPDVDSVRVLTPHREGVGVKIAAPARVLNVRLFTDYLTVTDWQPPELLVVEHRGIVRGLGVWSLDAVSGGTRLRWSEHLSLPLPIIGELALLAYRPLQRRLMRRAITELGRRLAGPQR